MPQDFIYSTTRRYVSRTIDDCIAIIVIIVQLDALCDNQILMSEFFLM
jgi:hypothetical protein